MAIKITENGVVNYENSPDVNRKLFPNLNICGKEINELADEIDGKAPLIVNTASGSIASFDSGADDMPLKSCIVSLEPIQEGEGDPSPDNVRPISGRTGLTVYHSGSDTTDPTTISVNWETEAGTVYGGTLDVVSGKLAVDRSIVVFDGTQTISQANWRPYDDSSAWLYHPMVTPGIDNIIGKAENLTCDKLKPIPYVGGDGGIYGDNVGVSLVGTNAYGIGMRVPISGLTTATLINAWLSENPITVVYQLATPTEIQLSPQEITTLLGDNNIWSDGGDISVEYPADTKMYIDALGIKTVEVSGQTPTITAEENTRYICGEVTSLTFTPCETGICDVRFTAASISTVLTLPETVKLPEWFDPTLLEANTTYEINIVDGIYGVVMSWA